METGSFAGTLRLNLVLSSHLHSNAMFVDSGWIFISLLLCTTAFTIPLRHCRNNFVTAGRQLYSTLAQENNENVSVAVLSRSRFLQQSVPPVVLGTASLILAPTLPSYAFEGGVGGLGKTKPETGVTLRDGFIPLQNSQGFVTGEILSPVNGRPILVQFQSPWPLLPTTSGLEARDLRDPESAFVQVVTNKKKWTDANSALKVISESVLGQQGKFGAYASPFDIKVKTVTDSVVECKFTTYTPSLRESDRQVLVKQQDVGDNTLVLLVAGTTSLRYPAQRNTFLKVIDSFEAVAAPQSSLKR